MARKTFKSKTKTRKHVYKTNYFALAVLTMVVVGLLLIIRNILDTGISAGF